MSRNRDLLPWWDNLDWMTDPALSYVKGLQDGVQLGREQVDAELVAALARALSGGATADYAQAVDIHERRVDQRQRREALDDEAACARSDDYRGRAAA